MNKITGNYIFLFFLLAIVCLAFGAKSVPGVRTADYGEDTTRVNNLILASENQFGSDPVKAIRYARQANDLAIKINFKKGSAYALKNIGSAYYIQGNYNKAIEYWEKSLKIFQSIKDELGEANLLSNLGAVYFNLGKDVIALDHHLKSLKVSEKIGNKLRIATSLINIGAVYYRKEATHDKAIQYYLRALPLSEDIGNKDAIGTASVNLGEIYLENGQDSLALHYFKKSQEAYKGSVNLPYSLNNIAKVYLERKDYAAAINYHEQALAASEVIDGQLDIAQSVLGLGNTYASKGDKRKAITYYKRAEAIASAINSQYELKSAYQGLASSYAALGNYGQAYVYQNLLTEITDSLYNIETDKRLSEVQFDFDIQKKQAEINLLIKDRALQQLELRRQRFAKNSLIGGFILVFIIAFMLFRNSRNKSRTNKLLDKQKAEIEDLLSNMLPEEVAKELQRNGQATPRFYESVSVLFSDFKNFTHMADALSPQDIVLELNGYFMAFDDIIEKYGLEKIKTIGDAYMCAGGIPAVDETHPIKIVKASLEIQKYIDSRNELKKETGNLPWELRIGIHTGPVVAGVVGRKKYAYDIWGSTVNTASRMESNGEPGRVNISADTYELVKDHYVCTYRGKILAKNVGEVDMYFVESEISNHPLSEMAKLKQEAYTDNKGV
ncbi:tetratricopeptide repeat protein [Flavihumibacter sp. R14]|nr:tetratricopeptide repeat protein [Flavihumibacter soli]